VLSERKLIQLVAENHVDGRDDPRMPARKRGAPEFNRTVTPRDSWKT
jgi:hypothetical protein